MKPLRVLVVDDSAVNRRVLASTLEAQPGVTVVGAASDGEQALRMVSQHGPDLITLDLEMPRMDGFTVLRLIMANRPTPIVVVSSHSSKEQVFRALELGAIDFIAKPDVASGPGGREELRAQLANMIAAVRQLSPMGFEARTQPPPPPGQPRRASKRPALTGVPGRVIAIAASTGGPSALTELFAALPSSGDAAIAVAQHMPERFTRTFAERLDRQGSFPVREAEHGLELTPHSAVVCPGGRCLEVERRADRLITRVLHPASTDRHAPSADRLFASVARALGPASVGVVLTGMGDDAARGVVEIKKAGGLVLAESEATAVIYGMPRMAVQTGCVDAVLPLAELMAQLRSLVSS
jgi:two-component system chemotaxis response regulator CheB